MADEDTVLEEAMENLKEAGQRIRATQSLMPSQGMTDGETYRDLLTRLSTALAMTEAAYFEAKRRRDLWLAAGLRVLTGEVRRPPAHDHSHFSTSGTQGLSKEVYITEYLAC
jgi:predicted RNase H-like HicB family nuclease